MKRVPLQLIIAMVIFGTIGLVRRWLPCSSSVIALARALIGVMFLLGIKKLKGEEVSWSSFQKQPVLFLLSGGMLGFNWILLFEAYQYTSVSVATMCYYMAPVIVVIVSPILFQESITVKKICCGVVAVVGMVFVSGVLETEISGSKGILYGLAAAVLYAGIVICNKKMKEVTAMDRTIFQLGISAIIMMVYVIFTENLRWICLLDEKSVVLLVVAGVVHTGIAYALYFGSIEKYPAQTVAIMSYLDPAVAVVVSATILQESLSILGWIGVILIFSATIIKELGHN